MHPSSANLRAGQIFSTFGGIKKFNHPETYEMGAYWQIKIHSNMQNWPIFQATMYLLKKVLVSFWTLLFSMFISYREKKIV